MVLLKGLWRPRTCSRIVLMWNEMLLVFWEEDKKMKKKKKRQKERSSCENYYLR